LWSTGRYTAAEESLQEGLGVARDLGDVWGTAYGLTYLSNVQAWSGELKIALRTSREAVALAEGLGAEYLQAQALGLDGLAVQLAWVHLLHQVADPAIFDDDVSQTLERQAQGFPLDRPMRGAPEVLGLEVARALRLRRPAVEAAELTGLIAKITDLKAGSLKPAEQEVFHRTRHPWGTA
jgi:hypothetical protein